MKKDYNKLLDEWLIYVHSIENNSNSLDNFIDKEEIRARQGLEDNESDEMIEKLIKDGYIKRTGDDRGFALTFSGYVFIQDGMYKSEHRRKIISEYRDTTVAIAVAFGTVGLLIFEMWKDLH